jgi:hypothetical protein
MSDNELDETFDVPAKEPIDFKMPDPLTEDELKQLTELMKTKSNKELSTLILDVSIKNNPTMNDTQKMQLCENLKTNISSMSKRDLINVMCKIVNQQNKKLVFDDESNLKTMTTAQKLSREELIEKLKQKRMLNDKKKVQQIIEKLQEQNETENTEQSENTEKQNAKKKKNKKK